MARFDYILHRADGVTTVELNSQVGTFRAVTSEKLTAVRQDVWSAELTLISSEAFTVNVGDWIEAKGMRLYCMSTIDKYTCSEDNNREYQLTFYDPIYYLRQAIFYNTYESESDGVYTYSRVDNAYPSVGTFEDFVTLCCYNCNSVQGIRMFKVGTISESIATDIRVLTFSDYNCLAVLKQTCEEFETTWRVRINEDPVPDSVFIIDFGVAIEDFPVTLEVEKSKGLLSIEVTASDKDVFTQFVIKGGTENLPSDYPYTNLQLDEDMGGTPIVYANSMIKKPELYARWGKSVKELVNENIKPSRTGTVTAISENILKFTDSDLIGAEWSPVGGTIHFVSGHLIGFTFNCQSFNSETGEITIESTEENNGFILPSPTDSYYRINEEDKYNIAGVSLPASYVTAAKEELKEWAITKIDGYWSQPRMQAAVKIDPSIISVEVVPNMGLPIIHEALAINKIIKVQQVVYDLSKDSPYDIEDIIISDLKTDDSKADTTHRQIATTRSIVNGTGAGNVYEAKMISRQRILDDYAKSQNLPNWATFMEILSSGKGLWKDEDGNWWLNVAAIKAGAIGAELINVTQLIANSVIITGVQDIATPIANTAVGQLESDLEYLTEGFKDGSTYVTGGLVLSEFVGVTDGATPTPNVVAGMAGKNFVEEEGSPVDSPMFFAGANSAQNANNAKFRVYRDGRVHAEDIYVQGSTRNPYDLLDGYWDTELDDKKDNVYFDAGGWGISYDMQWDDSQSGRRRTVLIRGGSHTMTAPTGKYFYEDGIQKASITLTNEMVDLIGFADSTGFIGWVVLSRINFNTTYKYGRGLRAMALGRVYASSGEVANTSVYRTFDGSALTISNLDTGLWEITMPTGWFASANSYILSVTLESDVAGEIIWTNIHTRTATSFRVSTNARSAGGGTPVTRGFNFIIYNMEDWPATI